MLTDKIHPTTLFDVHSDIVAGAECLHHGSKGTVDIECADLNDGLAANVFFS